MKKTAATLFCVLVSAHIAYSPAAADAFEAYGLVPAAVIMKDADPVSFSDAMREAERLGAKGILGLPPTLIFGRFPPGTRADDFESVDVGFFEKADDIDPLDTDLVTLMAARGLLDEEKVLRLMPSIPTGPFEDLLLEVPREIVESTRPKDIAALRATPELLVDRGIDQNSEFLMGTVLVNLILPESIGEEQSENWTDEEIGNVIRDVLLGLSQYEQATLWAPVTFTLNCPSLHRGVPVFFEPISGDWDTDYIWIAEAMTYLGIYYDLDLPSSGSILGLVHAFNNAMRARFITSSGDYMHKWVFTSFVADASASDDNCWNEASYAAYSYYGGPYTVCCYPACRFGVGVNFAHVFIHEMSHTFWALDEYASAGQPCAAKSGYLNYKNGNSYYMLCGDGLDCIMNNALLTEPLPICPYTMGQVGLADDNENGIPDLYQVTPVVDLRSSIGADTTFTGFSDVSIVVRQNPVPNLNPMQDEDYRIDYAPRLIRAKWALNKSIWQELSGQWETREMTGCAFGFFLDSGLEPGENWIYAKFWNQVELSGIDSTCIYYVGVNYEEATAVARVDRIEIEWKTPLETFGADYKLYRQNLTAGTTRELLTTVDCDSIAEQNVSGKRYCYIDEDVIAGNTYTYQIVGLITLPGSTKTLEYPSRNLIQTAIVPIAGGFVSNAVPNPTDQRGSVVSIDVPRTYYSPSGTYSSSGGPLRAPAAVETTTDVLVEVFDVAGRKVRRVYDLSLFGGKIITVRWDGNDDRGKTVATGVYFMRVKAGQKEDVRKVVIIR